MKDQELNAASVRAQNSHFSSSMEAYSVLFWCLKTQQLQLKNFNNLSAQLLGQETLKWKHRRNVRFLAWKYGSFQLPLQRWGISTQWHHITHFALLNIYQGLEDQGAPAASIVLVSGCFTECRMEYLMIVQKSSRSLCSSGTTYQMFMVLFSGLSSRKKWTDHTWTDHTCLEFWFTFEELSKKNHHVRSERGKIFGISTAVGYITVSRANWIIDEQHICCLHLSHQGKKSRGHFHQEKKAEDILTSKYTHIKGAEMHQQSNPNPGIRSQEPRRGCPQSPLIHPLQMFITNQFIPSIWATKIK